MSSTSIPVKCWRFVHQPSYNPNDRPSIQGGLDAQTAPPLTFSSRARAAALHPCAGSPPESIAPTIVGTPRPDFPESRHTCFRVLTRLGAIDLATILANSRQRRAPRSRLSLQPANLEHADRIGPGPSDWHQAAIRRSAGLRHLLLAPHRAHLATLSHGSCLCHPRCIGACLDATIGAVGVSDPFPFERVSGPVPGDKCSNPMWRTALDTTP